MVTGLYGQVDQPGRSLPSQGRSREFESRLVHHYYYHHIYSAPSLRMDRTAMKEKLCRVSIEGFKSIKKCDIELGDINVLIGSNGAGKSNFISAFTFLHNYLKKELQLYSFQVGTNSLLYNGRKTTDTIRMTFSFSHNSFGFNLIPTENGRLIIKNEFYDYNGTTSSIKSSIGSAESHWDEGFDDDTNAHVKPSFSTYFRHPKKVSHSPS